jgi:hypothetical protein
MSSLSLNQNLFPDGFGAETPEATSWRCFFQEKTELVERVRGLPRPEAERAAFDIVLAEFLNRTHPDTDPNRCAYCRRLETPDSTLLPFGVGLRHAWLHDDCWASWRARRRGEAIDQLAAMGIASHDPNCQTDSRFSAMEVATIEGEHSHRVQTPSWGTIASAESGAAPSFDPYNHPCAVPGCRAYAPFGFGYPHSLRWFCREHAPR